MAEKERILEAIIDTAYEVEGRKRLDCTQAFAIAKRLSVKPADIGKACNDNDIRICNCQLGCFK